MVKAQVKGFGMQSDAHWYTPSAENTWSNPSAPIKSSPSSQSPNPAPLAGLKRSRSVSKHMTTLPPLPRLDGELILEVFTHRSLRFAGAPLDEDSEYGDSDRLAVMGEKAAETAVTDALFRKRPMLKGAEIESQRYELLSDQNIEEWVVAYKLRDKLRCSRDAVDTLKESKEARHLLFSYVGAVYVQHGMASVKSWIGGLVDPENEEAGAGASRDVDMDAVYNFKKLKTEQFTSPPEPISMPPPPPPGLPPPPLPLNPMTPAQPQAAFLPLFNQTANQRRLQVEYPAQFSGPAHAGRWTVKCVVNGIEKGTGTGASKQLAKEEAARQAYFAMGWAPHA